MVRIGIGYFKPDGERNQDEGQPTEGTGRWVVGTNFFYDPL